MDRGLHRNDVGRNRAGRVMKPSSSRPLTILAVITAIVAALSLTACENFNPFPFGPHEQWTCVGWHTVHPDSEVIAAVTKDGSTSYYVAAHGDSVCTPKKH
jgi:hypothetical protein